MEIELYTIYFTVGNECIIVLSRPSNKRFSHNKVLFFFYHMLIFRVDDYAHNYADHAHSDHRYRTGPIG